MKARWAALAALMLLLALSGCAAGGAYYKRVPYAERSETPAAATGRGVIATKDALYQAIKNAVDARKEREELTIQGYDGAWETDLEDIRLELREVYPYGKYAVESINSSSRRVYTQTQLSLDIKYWDSADELKDIVYVVSMADFEWRVSELLGEFVTGPAGEDSASRAFYFAAFSDDRQTLQDRLTKCWLQHADRAIDLREISASAFPADSQPCIIQVNIQYLEPRDTLLVKSGEIRAEAARVAALCEGETEREKINFVYRWLWENVRFDPEDFEAMPRYSRFTAYGGLVEKSAAQAGYALAAQVLCKALGLDSQLVVGSTDTRESYYWLYVTLDGEPTHFDPSAMRFEPPEPESEAETQSPSEDTDADADTPDLPAEPDYTLHVYLFDPAAGARRFRWNEAVYSLQK